MPVEDIRRRIREIDNSQEDPEFLPFISEELRKLADVPKPEKEIENKMDHENLKNEIKLGHENLKNEIKNEINLDHEYLKNEIKLDHENLKNEIKLDHENLLKEIENKLNRNNEQMLQTLLAEIKNSKK